MKITTHTGTLTLLLATAIAILPMFSALDQFNKEILPPAGSVAGIAIGGVIEPTPTNTLYAELQTEKSVLDNRTKELDAKERYLNTASQHKNYIIELAIGILFCLVLTNFYFDMRRNKKEIVQTNT